MDDVVDFRELMKLSSKDVDEKGMRPKGAPNGTWLTATVRKHDFQFARNEKSTPFCVLELADLAPKGDEDAAKVNGMDLSKIRSPYHSGLIVEYWLTPASFSRFSDMLDRVIGSPERDADSRAAELDGARIMFQVMQALDKDGRDTGQNRVDDRTVIKAA